MVSYLLKTDLEERASHNSIHQVKSKSGTSSNEVSNLFKNGCLDSYTFGRDSENRLLRLFVSWQIMYDDGKFLENNILMKADEEIKQEELIIKDEILSDENNDECCEKQLACHQVDEQLLHCSKCDKVFNSSHLLKEHIRSHSVEKPFINSVCYKLFSTSGDLITHIRIHTQEKRFKCVVCHKMFFLSSSLKTHTGEKPFKCLVCPKSFSQCGRLISHKRIHTDEKPYNCLVCHKMFSLSHSLTTHMRIHTDGKTI